MSVREGLVLAHQNIQPQARDENRAGFATAGWIAVDRVPSLAS